MRIHLILIAVVVFYAHCEDGIEQQCMSADAQQSCGQCIKAHSDCAWCVDPHSTLPIRCQLKSKFTNETCASQFIYSPQASESKVQQNMPLKSFHHDGKTLIRLQPQAASVKLMPGNSASVEFKYFHQSDPNRKSDEPEMMVIQTSDISEMPISLQFFIDCNGEKTETKSCPVKDGQIVSFQINVIANSCSNTGDLTLSVGIVGQRTIAGLYVTTVCGCECEKHPEINSRLCYMNGHLVCGQCICDQSRGGSKCECPLATYGVTTAAMLEEKCKFNSSSPTCSGSGVCKCGQCQCNAQTITGEFCQCDNNNCVSSNGKMCSGNGACVCGTCKCEPGFEHEDCSCLSSSGTCNANEKTPEPEVKENAITTTQKTVKKDDESETESSSSEEELEKQLDESDKDNQVQQVSLSPSFPVSFSVLLVFLRIL